MRKSDTIALTGATGFIGATLVQRLAASGRKIQALIRPASKHKRPLAAAVRWVEGDLEDMDSLHRLVKGADAVIHCAGTVRGATREQFNRVNADGLARLVNATKHQHPMPRFLLISSLAAREPHLSHYAASKRQGEKLLADKSNQLSWTIYRPCAVYGPGDREMLPILRWMTRGIAPMLGDGSGRFSLLYVKDLAEAVVQWLNCNCCQSGTYEVHDGHPGGYSWRDVIDTVGQLRAKYVLRLKIPLVLVRLAAAFNLFGARTFGYAPMLTPGKVRELCHPNWICDNTALSAATGWSPRISLVEGLQQTLSWNKA
ncbi:MAG: NAD-dependent epimerase/dehydratase family protein [Desulfobacterales bacterium]|nr:MAG: NAD-dependent epimerase/dehydratase family protein [Desulfobacterales bacterium]